MTLPDVRFSVSRISCTLTSSVRSSVSPREATLISSFGAAPDSGSRLQMAYMTFAGYVRWLQTEVDFGRLPLCDVGATTDLAFQVFRPSASIAVSRSRYVKVYPGMAINAHVHN